MNRRAGKRNSGGALSRFSHLDNYAGLAKAAVTELARRRKTLILP
jgi:hypothetical protein